jgi:tRNA(Ile)-lysidine synthase
MNTRTMENPTAWQELLAAVQHAWPPARWRDVGVVVACSGGADSVGLLLALAHLRSETDQNAALFPPRGFLVAAHYNHALRGAESDADETFVAKLAQRLNITFHTARGDGTQHDESGLRDQRVRFLESTAHQTGARYVVMAHSSDDNVETVLHHLLRGTGPAGLAGIAKTRPFGRDLVLVRPFLTVKRSLIRQGLAYIGQTWREDSSNRDTDYRRNWIRHQLIPLIETEYPQAADAIQRLSEAQSDWRAVIEKLANQWLDAHLEGQNPIEITSAVQTNSAILVAATQLLWDRLGWPRGLMGREHWLRLASTLQSGQSQPYTLPGNLQVVASAGRIRLTRHSDA